MATYISSRGVIEVLDKPEKPERKAALKAVPKPARRGRTTEPEESEVASPAKTGRTFDNLSLAYYLSAPGNFGEQYGHWSPVPDAINLLPGDVLSTVERDIFKCIFSSRGSDGLARVGYGRLARVSGGSRNTVIRAVEKLVKLGLVKVRKGNSARGSSVYELIPTVKWPTKIHAAMEATLELWKSLRGAEVA
jgi:hypothetical protein